MVWKAAHEGFFALLVSDAQTELQVGVYLAEEGLDLDLLDQDEGLGVVVDVPDVISWVKVSKCMECQGSLDLQVPLALPELALVEEGSCNVL